MPYLVPTMTKLSMHLSFNATSSRTRHGLYHFQTLRTLQIPVLLISTPENLEFLSYSWAIEALAEGELWSELSNGSTIATSSSTKKNFSLRPSNFTNTRHQRLESGESEERLHTVAQRGSLRDPALDRRVQSGSIRDEAGQGGNAT